MEDSKAQDGDIISIKFLENKLRYSKVGQLSEGVMHVRGARFGKDSLLFVTRLDNNDRIWIGVINGSVPPTDGEDVEFMFHVRLMRNEDNSISVDPKEETITVTVVNPTTGGTATIKPDPQPVP